MAGYGGKAASRERRHRRVRKRVVGSAERPRLCVFKSACHIYAQIIDDGLGKTLAAASTLSTEVKEKAKTINKTDAARLVGEALATRALAARVDRVIFDRGGYKFHGRVKALATGAREKGLKF